jgi:hypothetical protein
VGDSGEELGEGSVSDESTVDIVVVGDDSAESDFKEPRRDPKDGLEECALRRAFDGRIRGGSGRADGSEEGPVIRAFSASPPSNTDV